MKPLSIDDVNKMDESQLKEIDLVELKNLASKLQELLQKILKVIKEKEEQKRLNDAMASYDENNSLNNISYY